MISLVTTPGQAVPLLRQPAGGRLATDPHQSKWTKRPEAGPLLVKVGGVSSNQPGSSPGGRRLMSGRTGPDWAEAAG